MSLQSQVASPVMEYGDKDDENKRLKEVIQQLRDENKEMADMILELEVKL